MNIEVALSEADINRIADAVTARLKARETGDGKRMFTVETLAKHLSVTAQWVYERVARREIPHLKLGRFVRFDEAAISKWLTSRSVPVTNPLSSRLLCPSKKNARDSESVECAERTCSS